MYVVLLTLMSTLLSAPVFAQEAEPSVTIKIAFAGAIPGDAVLLPPRQKPGEQAVLYPTDAAADGISGTVKLKLLVDTNGSIKATQTIWNGHDERLVNAALEGLRKTGLTAGTVDKKPTKMWVNVEVVFDASTQAIKNDRRSISATHSEIDSSYSIGAEPLELPEEFEIIAQEQEQREYGIGYFVPAEILPTYDKEELARVLEYPRLARLNDLEGNVLVGVQVDTNGRPLQVIIRKSSIKIFNNSAVEAASAITYTPGWVNGKPVKMWLIYPIKYRLE